MSVKTAIGFPASASVKIGFQFTKLKGKDKEMTTNEVEEVKDESLVEATPPRPEVKERDQIGTAYHNGHNYNLYLKRTSYGTVDGVLAVPMQEYPNGKEEDLSLPRLLEKPPFLGKNYEVKVGKFAKEAINDGHLRLTASVYIAKTVDEVEEGK
jgi:hypothetical protein